MHRGVAEHALGPHLRKFRRFAGTGFAELGAAAVRGFQGKHLSSSNSVLACAKHFVGDGGTENGKDQGNAVCDEATLRKLYLPPYAAAIKAGVGSIMVSYSSWNGKKCTATNIC